jgi:hypothetical protein
MDLFVRKRGEAHLIDWGAGARLCAVGSGGVALETG